VLLLIKEAQRFKVVMCFIGRGQEMKLFIIKNTSHTTNKYIDTKQNYLSYHKIITILNTTRHMKNVTLLLLVCCNTSFRCHWFEMHTKWDLE